MSSRCGICPCKYTPMAGSGPLQSQVLFIGERPDEQAFKNNFPISGRGGEEFDNTYLRRALLRREDVRCEYAVRCWTEDDRFASDTTTLGCAEHFMPGVLGECEPDVIVLLGARACLLADRKLKIDTHHGLPYYGTLMGGLWRGTIVPSYSPGLGLKDTSKMANIIEDFELLGQFLQGKWSPPEQELYHKDYAEAVTAADISAYVRANVDSTNRVWPGVDMETHGPKPWSAQFSFRPHGGRLIRAESIPALKEFNRYLNETRTGIILHNAPNDLDYLDRMHVNLDKLGLSPPQIRDTMQESFHQNSLPQGLKPLAYRLLGVTMNSWEDVVWPASIQLMLDWMESAKELAEVNLQSTLTEELKTQLCISCGHKHSKKCSKCECKLIGFTAPRIKTSTKPGAVESIMKHMLRYTSLEGEYNPWEKYEDMKVEGLRKVKPPAEHLNWVYEMIGPPPILGIGNAKFTDALDYAVSDADHTLQVANVLAQRRGLPRWLIADRDRDWTGRNP